MIKASGIKGEDKLRWVKSFKSQEDLDSWVKENNAEVKEVKDLDDTMGESAPTIDNDYTFLDLFLSQEIADISKKKPVLKEESNNDNIDSKDVTTGFESYLGDKDETDPFYVVTKPCIYGKDTTTISTLGDICFKSTILGMCNQVRGGLNDKGEIWGFYKDKNKAVKIAKEILKDKKTWIHKD